MRIRGATREDWLPFFHRRALHRRAGARPTDPPVAHLIVIVLVGLAVNVSLAPLDAAAQTPGPDPGAAAGQIEEAAARAESAAAEVRALIERARQGETAEAPAETEPESRDAEEAQSAPDSSPDPLAASEIRDAERAATDRALEDAERAASEARAAAEEARAAAREARIVANAARQEMKAYRNRYVRTGPFLGVAAFYALEDFDSSSLDFDDSYGGAVFAGYRVHRHIAIEIRGEILDGFEIESLSQDTAGAVEADIDGFLITAGPKFYPFAGVLQPFVGLGLGAMRAELEGRREDGSRFGDRATEAVIRPAAGLDFYVSESLVLNFEAAYVSPGSSLDGLDFATFSTGLTFRF